MSASIPKGRSLATRARRTASALLLLCLAAGLPAAGARTEPPALEPRRTFDAGSYPPPAAGTAVHSLIVKFREDSAVRLRDGVLQSTQDRGAAAEAALRDELAEARRLLSLAAGGTGLRPLFSRSEASLAESRRQGESKSGRQLADLSLYYRLGLPAGTSAEAVSDLLRQLNALPVVEVAYVPSQPRVAGFFEATRQTAGAATPDFTSQQTYRDAAPLGIDVSYAWGFSGGRGGGVKIMDVEGAIDTDHEDLPTFFYEDPDGFVDPTDPDRTQCFEYHGVATLGELVGRDNGLGITGIVPDAAVGFESWATDLDPQNGNDLSDAIDLAAARLAAGDILLLEVQLFNSSIPSQDCTPCGGSTAGCGLTPVEWEPANFDAIATATATGIVVIEAAGNGHHSLDHPNYQGLFSPTAPSSGAILVAAHDPTLGPGVPACFTNHGSRIDLHSWGRGVVTTGYGDLHGCVADPPDCSPPSYDTSCDGGLPAAERYTGIFSGTSSASPIVAGAAVSLQGIAKATLGTTLTPAAIRDLLVDTGTPQANDPRQIGPQPDLRAAVDDLLDPNLPPVARPDVLTSASCTSQVLISATTLLANDDDPDGDPLDGPCTYSAPQHGSLGLLLGGGVRYRPESSLCAFGTDAFLYTIWDRPGCTGLSSQAWAVIAPQLDGESLLEDFFESADLDGWSGSFVSGSGGVAATSGAALNAGFGLEVSLDGAAHAYVYDDRPLLETHYLASFLFDPNSIAMEGQSHTLFSGVVPGITTTVQLRLRQQGGVYQVRLDTWDDQGTFATLPSWVSLVDGPQLLEVEWRAASAPGANDGAIRLHLGGSLAGERKALDNDESVVERVRFGAVGAAASITGSYFLDDFRSRRGDQGLEGLFGDDFESIALQWDGSYVPSGGSLLSQPGAALSGGRGLEVTLVTGGTHVFLQDETPSDESRYEAAFRFDPNSLAIGAESHVLAAGTDGSQTTWQMRLRKQAGVYQVRLDTWLDNGSFVSLPATGWADLVDGPNALRLRWRAASLAAAGELRLWVGGSAAGVASGLDNDTRRVERVRFGKIGTATTPGSFYLDEFRSWR